MYISPIPWLSRRILRLLGVCLGTISAVGLTFAWVGKYTAAADITATVDYARSGHTLELLSVLSLDMPVNAVRLEAIAAPDPQLAPWGGRSRDCLADLGNQIIRLETDDWTADKYGRLWAYAWKNSELINRRVLEQGCAYLQGDRWAHRKHYQELLYAQELARLLDLGIWDPKNPFRGGS